MKRWQAALRLIGMGWYVGLCIVLGVLGGLWLDDHVFHTKGIFVIIGLIVGVILAFYGVYRMLLPNINRQDKGKG